MWNLFSQSKSEESEKKISDSDFSYEFVPKIFSNGEFLTGPVKKISVSANYFFCSYFFFLSLYIADLKKKRKIEEQCKYFT